MLVMELVKEIDEISVCSKAVSPIVVREVGKTMLVKLLQKEKASYWISFTPLRMASLHSQQIVKLQ